MTSIGGAHSQSPSLPPSSPAPSGLGGDLGSSDGISEQQHFLEVADYVSRLKLRVEKMLLATSALVKHSAHTAGVLMQFAAVVCDLDQAEARATAVFYNNPSSALAGSAAAGVAGAGGAGAGAGHIPTVEGVQWMAAARLFAAASGPPRAHADAVTAAFQEPLEAAAALCQACVSSCDVRKGIVDHYNRLCRQIERLDSKVSTLGVPEPGPKREEKQKVELAASDLRIARTQAMGRYERCCEYMAHELLWFHTELARTLGAALQALVAAQGAAAGQALHACQGHFAAILSAPPAAFRGALGEGAVGGPGSSGSAGSAGSAGGVGDAGGRLEFGGVMHGGVDAGVTA